MDDDFIVDSNSRAGILVGIVQMSAKSQPAPAMTLEEAVWVDSGRMSGTPCFRGTRLPVQQLFDWLADGVPLEDFIRDFKIDRRAAATVLRVGSVAVKRAALRNPACSDHA